MTLLPLLHGQAAPCACPACAAPANDSCNRQRIPQNMAPLHHLRKVSAPLDCCLPAGAMNADLGFTTATCELLFSPVGAAAQATCVAASNAACTCCVACLLPVAADAAVPLHCFTSGPQMDWDREWAARASSSGPVHAASRQPAGQQYWLGSGGAAACSGLPEGVCPLEGCHGRTNGLAVAVAANYC